MQPTGIIDAAKATNPLKDLLKFGQSVWLDYIRRDLITGGELKRLIDEDGLRGMTSNPAIFEKAIAGSADYADILASLKDRSDLDAKARYELVAIRDIQDVADMLRPVYQESQKRDGYVSLEVSPYLALDTYGTIEEARRLWKTVDRPNIMIKVPGTAEGIPAFEQLISEGININVTLLFSQEVYQRSRRSLHPRPGKVRRQRRRSRSRRQRRQLLHQPHRHLGRRGTFRARKSREDSSGRAETQRLVGKSRHRQRQDGLPALPEYFLRRAMGQTLLARRSDPARALGQHRHQEPRLLRHPLCAGNDRPRHRQHHPPRDA